MVARNLMAVVATALLTGCGSKSPPAKIRKAAVRQALVKAIDGYGDIKFGSTLNQAMIRYGDRFDGFSVKDCYRNLPINGCTLETEREGAPFEMREGIPYRLSLIINKFDQLTDVELTYDRDKDITGDECRSIHERTLDWLTREYGKFYSPTFDPAEKPFRTPGGNSYLGGVPGRDRNWITQFMRTFTGTPTAALLKQPSVKWDDRPHVMLFSQYIRGHCEVQATFSDRRSVPRPDWSRAIRLDMDE